MQRGQPLRRTPLKSTGTKSSTTGGGLRRSAPLQSKTPLQNKTPLQAAKPLQNKTPLQAKTGLQAKSRLQAKTELKRSPTQPGTAEPRKPLTTTRPLQRTASLSASPATPTVDGQGDTKPKKPRQAPIKQKRRQQSPEEVSCRRIVAARSGGICEICGKAEAAEKAHRLGRGQGGPWLPSNILDACKSCHTANHGTRDRHNGPEKAYAYGWHLQRGTVDFAAQPVMLWKGSRSGWALLADDGSWAWTEQGRDAA